MVYWTNWAINTLEFVYNKGSLTNCPRLHQGLFYMIDVHFLISRCDNAKADAVPGSSFN